MQEIQRQCDLAKTSDKKGLSSIISKNLMIEFRITKFVNNFKIRYERKKKGIHERMQIALHEEVLNRTSGETDTVESCMSIRGNIDFKLRAYESKVVLDRVKSKCEANSFDKFYFCFFDDILAWKQKSNSSKVEGKVFLISIEEIGVEKENFFYFVTKKFIYFFKCENSEVRNRWARSITFLKDNAIKELKPLDFEKYDSN